MGVWGSLSNFRQESQWAGRVDFAGNSCSYLETKGEKWLLFFPITPKFYRLAGNSLNVHPHFHILVADGVFSAQGEDLLFHEAILTPDDIADTQDAIQRRVLLYFKKRGKFDQETVEKMRSIETSGFSLDASVRTEAMDRTGLERLIRYCARPPFASENLRWNGPWLVSFN